MPDVKMKLQEMQPKDSKDKLFNKFMRTDSENSLLEADPEEEHSPTTKPQVIVRDPNLEALTTFDMMASATNQKARIYHEMMPSKFNPRVQEDRSKR
mmetsp:Transcript_44685/g.32732  ORF Transcript_44685/g.32732 Transcript_44685/m.32732 type:complete len:97 (+) Transcript_44685:397-687(+)|eukprot:CAMPEP_0202979556 /NCGR_PEP_ID=MMETSP1396-20130829/85674_1 /ASSEMBLY_ACC=CAM_ASM_000872 /TAXON_ID= /ORGANISM="Pseudokeronopsis sp., Strain Brazil" /LENGTH=96 /DNA_ID=CAMNT_0049719031 /DNA_START=956 /DNA_END=1246 /DNA_ORIENTATION=-